MGQPQWALHNYIFLLLFFLTINRCVESCNYNSGVRSNSNIKCFYKSSKSCDNRGFKLGWIEDAGHLTVYIYIYRSKCRTEDKARKTPHSFKYNKKWGKFGLFFITGKRLICWRWHFFLMFYTSENREYTWLTPPSHHRLGDINLQLLCLPQRGPFRKMSFKN